MTTERLHPESDTARAYRMARKQNPRRPAILAVAEARHRLARVAEAEAAYLAANPAKGDAAGPGALPVDAAEGVTSRAAYVDAKARAGLYHTRADWRIWPAATTSKDGTAIHLTHESGAGAVRYLERASGIRPSLPRGYYDNPEGQSARDGSGLIWGVVAFLSHGRRLAGWVQGGCDGGPTLAARIFDGPEAAEDAAAYADGMAERVAEAERDRAEAWQAGARWAELGQRLAELRAEIPDWVAEARRLAEAAGVGRKAVCEGLRRRLAERAEAMAERNELAAAFDHVDGWAEGADI